MVTDPLPNALGLRGARDRGSRASPESVPYVSRFCGGVLWCRGAGGSGAPCVPDRVREGDWGTELFGDYRFDEKLIRVWMRTAIQQRVTSLGRSFRRLPMSLPSPRRGALRVFGDAAYAPLFRAGGGVVPPCSGTPAKRLVWRPFGRATQDRLGEDESRLRRR